MFLPPLPLAAPSSLASFCARTCHALWRGSISLLATPDALIPDHDYATHVLYAATPLAFEHLVHNTLHPHHSPHIAAAALLYIQRYINALPMPPVTHPGSEARVWCTALLVAIKQHDDRAGVARMWAGSRIDDLIGGGMSVDELVAMEEEFLVAIDWRLGVQPGEFSQWVTRLTRFRTAMESAAFNSGGKVSTPRMSYAEKVKKAATPTVVYKSVVSPAYKNISAAGSRKRSVDVALGTIVTTTAYLRRDSTGSSTSTAGLSTDSTDDILDDYKAEIVPPEPVEVYKPVDIVAGKVRLRKRSVKDEDAIRMRAL